jgi:hypothetical protein
MAKTKSKNNVDEIPRRSSRSRDVDVKPVLVPRSVTQKLLGGVAVSYVIKLERLGLLDAIRLNPESSAAQVFHRYQQVQDLVNTPPIEVER